MLEGDIQIRQDFALGHQRDDFIHMRVRVDIVQAHPGAQLAQLFAQLGHPCAHRAALPEAGAVFDVHAVGAGVLRHHQQLFGAALDQRFGFFQHFMHRPAVQIAAQTGDDAEGAAVITAFRNFQIGIVARGELDASSRHQVHERIVRLGQVLVDVVHHLAGGVWAGHGQHRGVHVGDHLAVVARAQTAGDDHLAVFVQRLADGVQRFGHGRINKATGVDHHQVGAIVAGGDFIAFGAQSGEDVFRVNQRLGTA